MTVLLISVLSFSYMNAGMDTELEGELGYDASHDGIYLMTMGGMEKVDLSFAYDKEDELYIDDFGRVKVKGKYYSLSNILRVEEIDEATELPLLCYIGR